VGSDATPAVGSCLIASATQTQSPPPLVRTSPRLTPLPHLQGVHTGVSKASRQMEHSASEGTTSVASSSRCAAAERIAAPGTPWSGAISASRCSGSARSVAGGGEGWDEMGQG
jgi:hypothetical protein